MNQQSARQEKIRRKPDWRKWSALLYALAIILLSFLFFTNDFGLVDIRKTSIIVGVGIDVRDEQIKLTAQIAVPQPAENGENTQFTSVDGEGETVAAALNQINAKIGFYPKLLFCKLVLLGESCQGEDIFRILDYFYRNEYTQLTPLVAMCKGEAGELMQQQLPFGENVSQSIERLLSDEAKKSANVSTVNLKRLGSLRYSRSSACFMPFIDAQPQGGQEGGSGGEGAGGSSGEGNSSGGGSSASQSGGSSGEQATDFLCTQTAYFNGGKFVGLLDEEQAFALNLLSNEVRRAIVGCSTEENYFTLGLKNCDGGISLQVKEGKPRLTLQFTAVAKVLDVNKANLPEEAIKQESTAKDVLKACEDKIRARFESLLDAIVGNDCDILGVRNLLYKYCYKDYEKFKDTLLSEMQTEYRIQIVSQS